MGENQIVAISSRDAHESARASLELCSSLKRQYFTNDDDFPTSICDSELDTSETVTAITEEGSVTFTVGGGKIIEDINTLKELVETLRIKDEQMAKLKALLVQRVAELQKLHNMIDMYRSVPSLRSTNGRIIKHRPQGGY